MFERRFADKLTYFDWKLAFMVDERDFEFLVDKKEEVRLSAKTHAEKKH